MEKQLQPRIQGNTSLTRTTVINLFIRMLCVFILSAILSYGHMIGQSELKTQDQLQKYVTERGKREEAIFKLAVDQHAMFKQEFLEAVKLPLSPNTMTTLYLWSDGTHRNFPEGQDLQQFDSKHKSSVFVGRGVTLTKSLLRRIGLFEKLLQHYGPAWRNRFVNTYLVAPENIAVTYWPEVPGPLMVKGDFDVRKENFFYLSDVLHDPERQTVWTGSYHDPASPDWIVSVVTPIDNTHQHIATVGHDIILNELIQRTTSDRWSGTYNLIFRQDGNLIVHPNFASQINAKHGNLNITELGDAHLNRIYDLVHNQLYQAATAKVLDNSYDREFLAVTQLSGPQWYFVTVYPKSLMQDDAWNAAEFVLLSGGIALILEIAIIYDVLRQQIAHPLQQMLQATKQLSKGDFAVHLPPERNDELGQLSNAFNQMSQQLQDLFSTLEQRITERTIELQSTNQELERLSRVDGLTQIANRRYFDNYLTQEWQRLQQEKQPLGLILCDVDYFKIYNDTYGHLQGDWCLQQVAKILQQIVTHPTALIARYGGEEFVVILPNSDISRAIIVAQSIQEKMRQSEIPHEGSENKVLTISLGVVSMIPTQSIFPESLIALADKALYEAKQCGRNQYVARTCTN